MGSGPVPMGARRTANSSRQLFTNRSWFSSCSSQFCITSHRRRRPKHAISRILAVIDRNKQATPVHLLTPNDNVLIAPSRNVLLTSSGWRGGFRNTSHDATGPRPSGRIGQSERHVRRLLRRLKGKGDAALLHGFRGRESNRQLDGKISQAALEILSRKIYSGFGPTRVRAGRETVRTWMIEGQLTAQVYLISMIDDASSRLHAALCARFDRREHALAVELP